MYGSHSAPCIGDAQESHKSCMVATCELYGSHLWAVQYPHGNAPPPCMLVQCMVAVWECALSPPQWQIQNFPEEGALTPKGGTNRRGGACRSCPPKIHHCSHCQKSDQTPFINHRGSSEKPPMTIQWNSKVDNFLLEFHFLKQSLHTNSSNTPSSRKHRWRNEDTVLHFHNF